MVSFKLDQFTAGGALPDGPYRFTESQIVEWDYDGKLQGSTLAFRSDMIPLDGKGVEAGGAIVQHWSIGDPAKFGPSGDGMGIVARGASSSLGKGSNFFLFLQNLIGNAGFPEDKYNNDVSVFDGLEAQLVNIPQPKRAGLPKSNLVTREGQEERERTIPVVKEIIKLPWEKRGKAGYMRSAPTQGKKGEVSEDLFDIELTLSGAIGDILDNNKKGIDRTQARVQLFRALKADASLTPNDRDQVVAMFSDDDKLEETLEPLGFTLAGGGKKIQPSK